MTLDQLKKEAAGIVGNMMRRGLVSVKPQKVDRRRREHKSLRRLGKGAVVDMVAGIVFEGGLMMTGDIVDVITQRRPEYARGTVHLHRMVRASLNFAVRRGLVRRAGSVKYTRNGLTRRQTVWARVEGAQ